MSEPSVGVVNAPSVGVVNVDTERWVDYYRGPWVVPVEDLGFDYYPDEMYSFNRLSIDTFVNIIRGTIPSKWGPVHVVDARLKVEYDAGHVKYKDLESINCPYSDEIEGFPNVRDFFNRVYEPGIWLFHCGLCTYRAPTLCLAFRYLHAEAKKTDPLLAFVAKPGLANPGGFPAISEHRDVCIGEVLRVGDPNFVRS